MLKVLYKHKKLLLYTPLVIHWISIFVLTSLPSQSLPHFAVSDKIKHFIAYFVLSILLTLSLKVQSQFQKIKSGYVKFAFIISGVYATFDELHQYFIPGRDVSGLDWFANIAGIFVGILLVMYIIHRNEKSVSSQAGTEAK